MATKTFGKEQKTSQDYIADIYKLAGAQFPIEVTVANGQLIKVTYETEWKEGSTTPYTKPDGTIGYKANYTNKKLTVAQIKKIDAHIKEHIEAA